MLPIVQRELQVAARSRNFYKWRLRMGVCLVLLSFVIILSTRGGLRPGAAGDSFQTLCSFALLFCLVEGIRKTSDTISEEKRAGTLGFLFLTDLKGFDIVLGKLAAAAIRSFNTLLAFVPVLAITLLLGGTTGGEFWRMALGLVLALGLSLSVCVFTSTVSREKFLGAATMALVTICFLPFAAQLLVRAPAREWISAASPFSLLFNAASDAFYRRAPAVYWAGIGWLVLISSISIIAASLTLPRVWQDRRRQTSIRITNRRTSLREVRKRREMLNRNPAIWLMFDWQRQRWLHGFAYVVGIGTATVLILLHTVLPGWKLNLPDELSFVVVGIAAAAIILAAYLYTARESSRNLAEARQNGALELVLSTPLNVDAIIEGQMRALTRVLALPAAVLFVLAVYVFVFAIFTSEISSLLFAVKTVTEAVLGIFTVAKFGMWMALTSKGPTRAFFKTIAIGIVLPHLFCTPTIVNQIVLLVLAHDKVKAHFRRYVAERYLGTHTFGLSPVSTQATAPPVLR